MKRKFYNMTAAQLADARQKWADYTRLRRRPEKECLTCHTMQPNDRAHFCVSPKGSITSRCLTCHSSGQPHKIPHPPAPCPICEEAAVLVVDRRAPAPVAICRRCLLLVNAMATPAMIGRVHDYLEWRAIDWKGG